MKHVFTCEQCRTFGKSWLPSNRAQHAPELLHRPIAKGDQSFTGTRIDVLKRQATSEPRGPRGPRPEDAGVKAALVQSKGQLFFCRGHTMHLRVRGPEYPFLARCATSPRPVTWHVLAPSDLFAGALEPAARRRDDVHNRGKQILASGSSQLHRLLPHRGLCNSTSTRCRQDAVKHTTRAEMPGPVPVLSRAVFHARRKVTCFFRSLHRLKALDGTNFPRFSRPGFDLGRRLQCF